MEINFNVHLIELAGKKIQQENNNKNNKKKNNIIKREVKFYNLVSA